MDKKNGSKGVPWIGKLDIDLTFPLIRKWDRRKRDPEQSKADSTKSKQKKANEEKRKRIMARYNI